MMMGMVGVRGMMRMMRGEVKTLCGLIFCLHLVVRMPRVLGRGRSSRGAIPLFLKGQYSVPNGTFNLLQNRLLAVS
jgi:hypothetical protein